MKLIFLDFDGVVNNPGCYEHVSGAYVPADPRCMAALNHLTDTTGALIVVSSTWRLDRGGVLFCKEKLREWGATGKVMSMTPRLPGQGRGLEIDKWLKDAEGWRDIESFVILDDDSDMEPHMDRLVQTQGHVGLTMADAERAIAVLAVSTSGLSPLIGDGRA